MEGGDVLMALLSTAVAGGVVWLSWSSITPTTKVVLMTVLLAMVYDGLLLDDNDTFGPGDLAITTAGAALIMGVGR